jgi:hypothetical protein
MGYFSAVYFHIYMYIYYKPGFVLLEYIQWWFSITNACFH